MFEICEGTFILNLLINEKDRCVNRNQVAIKSFLLLKIFLSNQVLFDILFYLALNNSLALHVQLIMILIIYVKIKLCST